MAGERTGWSICGRHRPVRVPNDYENHLWPEVPRAGDDWLAERPDACVVADVNHYGHVVRKLYVTLGTGRRQPEGGGR